MALGLFAIVIPAIAHSPVSLKNEPGANPLYQGYYLNHFPFWG